jgi:hypothetical protein
MEWLVALVVVALAVVAGKLWRRRINRTALAAHDLHVVEAVAREDLAQLDRSLRGLELTLFTDGRDPQADDDFRGVMEAREAAAAALADAQRADDLSAVTSALGAGQQALARGLARHAGEEVPEPRPPCTFNPNHGPSTTEITWAAAGDEERTIRVCAQDARRVSAGGVPDARMVHDGHRLVPWFRADRTFAPYVEGWWGEHARNGDFPPGLVATMMAGVWEVDGAGSRADWSRRPDGEEKFKPGWGASRDWTSMDRFEI